MDGLVVSTWVVFTLVVRKIFFPWVVFDVKFLLLHSICNLEKCISINRDCWRLMVLFTIPTGVKLWQCIGVGGCGCPTFFSASLKIVACLQLRKSAPSSASVAEAITIRSITHNVKKCPIHFDGFGGIRLPTHEKMSTGMAVEVRLQQMQCVGVDVKYHV